MLLDNSRHVSAGGATRLCACITIFGTAIVPEQLEWPSSVLAPNAEVDGDFGNVDLIYIPLLKPRAMLLFYLGFGFLPRHGRELTAWTQDVETAPSIRREVVNKEGN